MLSRLTQQRKLLLGVTIVVFIISATLIFQTYQTMQIYNAADSICVAVPVGMNQGELSRHAESNQTPITYTALDTFRTQARFGFLNNGKENCGCVISLTNNIVTDIADTYCQSF